MSEKNDVQDQPKNQPHPSKAEFDYAFEAFANFLFDQYKKSKEVEDENIVDVNMVPEATSSGDNISRIYKNQ